MIFTNENGSPIERPVREDFETDVAFIRAFHAWKDQIAKMSSEAFDDAFRNAMQSVRTP